MKLEYSFNSLQLREFEVIDADGWLDIVLNAWGGNLFKTANNVLADILLNNLVWKNNKGIFEKLNKEQKLLSSQATTYLKSYVINGKLKFSGIRGNSEGTNPFF